MQLVLGTDTKISLTFGCWTQDLQATTVIQCYFVNKIECRRMNLISFIALQYYINIPAQYMANTSHQMSQQHVLFHPPLSLYQQSSRSLWLTCWLQRKVGDKVNEWIKSIANNFMPRCTCINMFTFNQHMRVTWSFPKQDFLSTWMHNCYTANVMLIHYITFSRVW